MRKPQIIDLTKPLDKSLEIHRDGNYSDPPFKVIEWCMVANQGYNVSRLELGTQTGTHIDAPAHFIEGGPALDALSIDQLIGKYFLIDLPLNLSSQETKQLLQNYSQQPILFLRSPQDQISEIEQEALADIIKLPCPVWVVAGTIIVKDAQPLAFHRHLAQAGKFLAEDLSPQAYHADIPSDGDIIALPLRLMGTSGAPCRVVIRY